MYDSTSRIRDIISRVRREANAAEREFDRANRSIQRKASSSIDLFGGTATSQVVEIASDARRACDNLYATYQTLIQELDEQCHPLLDSTTKASVIQEVAELIKWLNDESEIENNFTASLNSRSLGHVASAKYVPKMENKMIQRRWESRYASTPEALEAERRAAEMRRDRERLRAEARAREQEERRRKEEEAKRQKALRAEINIREKEHMDHVIDDTHTRLGEYQKCLSKETQARCDTLLDQLNDKIAEYNDEAEKCRQKLKKTSIFQSGKKKTLRRQIQRMQLRIQLLSREGVCEEEFSRLKEISAAAYDCYKLELNNYIDRRFPNRNQAGKKDLSPDQPGQYYENPDVARQPCPAVPDPALAFEE